MSNSNNDKARKEGNFCIATGVGVGAVGVLATAVSGIVCPLCYFVPPLLIGAGIYQRGKGSKEESNENQSDNDKD